MVRPANSGEPNYSAGQVPEDANELRRFLQAELGKIEAAISIMKDGFLPVAYVVPTKLRKGMVRYADGTSWNPGSGEGAYRYNGTAWVLLG